MRALLFAFPDEVALAALLAAQWPADLGALRLRHFPDGESLLALDGECRGREVAFLLSFRDPDRYALPLLFAARTAREFGARRVGLIAPYLAYMRQDTRFNPGEAISALHFAEFLSSCFDWLLTVDPHLHRLASLDAVFRIPTRAISAMPAAARWLRDNITNPVLIGPDSESRQWVEKIAGLVGAPFQVLEKQRRGDRDVEVSLPDRAAILDRTPVLIDDIVASGHTMLETVGVLRRMGLAPPVCVAVHGIFADAADQALLAAGAARVISCNTLRHATNAIDVSGGLADAARELTRGAPIRP